MVARPMVTTARSGSPAGFSSEPVPGIAGQNISMVTSITTSTFAEVIVGRFLHRVNVLPKGVLNFVAKRCMIPVVMRHPGIVGNSQ